MSLSLSIVSFAWLTHRLSPLSLKSSAHDLDVPLTGEDLGLVEEFEAHWSAYMQEHPELMLSGGCSEKITELRGQVLDAKISQENVEQELQEQLKLFGRTRDLLESNYKEGMQESISKQKRVRSILQTEIDYVQEADKLEDSLVPWQHFIQKADMAAKVPTMEIKDRSIKPSQRAMALVDQEGDPSDVQLRAYRIDHALLSVQVEMLQKEITRVEKTTGGLDLTGQFLTENNIWALLSKAR